MRRRSIWIGAALLVAAVAAVPLWLSLDGGSRNQASLTDELATAGLLDCSRATNAGPCKQLNNLLLELDGELAEIYRQQQSVSKNLDAIKRNAHYLAATRSELSQQDMLELQTLLQGKSQLEQMITNAMKANAETQNALAAALKAS